MGGSTPRANGREEKARNRLDDDRETGASTQVVLRFRPVRRGLATGRMAR